MDNLSYIGLSRQIALRNMMNVTANNIANMSTPGYKSQGVLFREFLNKAAGEDGSPIAQVQDYGVYRDLMQGSLSSTGNRLDFALQGEGFFAVQTPDGVKYTRAGSFSLNEKGEIITKDGYQVLSEGGGPLLVPQGATQITATDTGTINTELASVGKLKIVKFDNPQKLVSWGDNLLSAGLNAETPVEKPAVVQGMLEASNVQPVLEMNKMIEILRSYQATQNMLNTDHDMTRTMIQKLTKV